MEEEREGQRKCIHVYFKNSYSQKPRTTRDQNKRSFFFPLIMPRRINAENHKAVYVILPRLTEKHGKQKASEQCYTPRNHRDASPRVSALGGGVALPAFVGDSRQLFSFVVSDEMTGCGMLGEQMLR